ncbi:MAG TPA: helix-hairpin-helix domain-containing protein, partial [Steroidobacteraceae bacterium]
MNQWLKYLPKRHFDALLRAGIVVIALAVAAVGFSWYQYAHVDSGPAEGSLIVNINTATQEEIETVPGVGSLRAMQIISNRPYTSVDQLARVYGVATEQVEQMRPYVKV